MVIPVLRRLTVTATAVVAAATPSIYAPSPARAAPPCSAPPPCITITTEGKRGYESTVSYFIVQSSQAMATPLTVRFHTVDGTARRGEDYLPPADETVTLPAGRTRIRVPVRLLADDVVEPDEFFHGVISDPSAGTITVGRAKMIIEDRTSP